MTKPPPSPETRISSRKSSRRQGAPATPRPRPLSRRAEQTHIIWDVLMVVLVMANLALLLFDTLYLIPPLNSAFEAVAPGLQALYDQYIHANFIAIDLAFVAVFVLDVLLGWAVAIAERRYHRWFFYPFVHWYDVLGCIPVGGFRLLRVLRVFSLLYRMQRLELIDIRHWRLYAVYAKYYDILLEELSDRIALRLLDNVQDQIRASDSLTEKVIDSVIMPRKQQLIQEITQRMEDMVGSTYQRNRTDLMRYVSALIGRTLAESPEIKRLRRLPMGGQVANALDASLSDIACRLVHEAAEGLKSPEFSRLVERIADSGMDAWLKVDHHSDMVTERVMIDMIEVIKGQVERQRWKERYD